MTVEHRPARCDRCHHFKVTFRWGRTDLFYCRPCTDHASAVHAYYARHAVAGTDAGD